MGILDALADPQFRKDVGNSLHDVLKGANNAVASNVSMPVDILAWLLRKGGAPIPENPIGGSDWMSQKGFTQAPQNKYAGMAGEVVGGVAPFAMAKNAPKIAGGLLNMGENLAAPATMNKQAGVINIDEIKTAFPSIDFALSQTDGKATLSKFVVPKSERNAGVGSAFMKHLTSAADADAAQLLLSPSSDFGGNKTRLIDFYKKFGFVPNKGKNIDYTISESMYRNPNPNNESLLTILERNGVPLQKPFEYPQAKALETARQNGVKMLGLPENNTPMDRARALGFKDEVYHGTGADIQNFDPLLADSRRKTGTPSGSIVVSSNPASANSYANEVVPGGYHQGAKYEDGGNVLPLMVNKGKNLSMNANGDPWANLFNPKFPDVETTNDFAALAKAKGKDSATIKKVKDNATFMDVPRYGDTTFVFDPSRIRSRFAAFDPARINESDLLAGALPFTAMIDDETRNQMIDRLRALTDSKAKKK